MEELPAYSDVMYFITEGSHEFGGEPFTYQDHFGEVNGLVKYRPPAAVGQVTLSFLPACESQPVYRE